MQKTLHFIIPNNQKQNVSIHLEHIPSELIIEIPNIEFYPIRWVWIVRVEGLRAEEPLQEGPQAPHVPLVCDTTSIDDLASQEGQGLPGNLIVFF